MGEQIASSMLYFVVFILSFEILLQHIGPPRKHVVKILFISVMLSLSPVFAYTVLRLELQFIINYSIVHLIRHHVRFNRHYDGNIG